MKSPSLTWMKPCKSSTVRVLFFKTKQKCFCFTRKEKKNRKPFAFERVGIFWVFLIIDCNYCIGTKNRPFREIVGL